MPALALVPAASSVWKVFKVARAINDAVATDRRNHKDYRGIMTCVDRVRNMLMYLQGARQMARHPAITPVLDDLARSLDEALEIIERFQGRKNKIHRLIVASKMAKDLRRVKEDIDHKLLMGIFGGMMYIITLTNPIQQRHQTSMVLIKIDLESEECYKKTRWTLCKIHEKMMIRIISFHSARNEVILKLVGKIVCRAQRVVEEIKIIKKKENEDDEDEDEDNDDDDDEDGDEDEEDNEVEEDDEDESDEDECVCGKEEDEVEEDGEDESDEDECVCRKEEDEEPDVVEDEGTHIRLLALNDGPAMTSEGPWSEAAAWENPSLLEGSWDSPQTTYSLRIPLDMTLGLVTNPSMIQNDYHDQLDAYPRACYKRFNTRDGASAVFFRQLDEDDENPAIIAPQPKRTRCPFGCKDVMILVQAIVIIVLIWYLM